MRKMINVNNLVTEKSKEKIFFGDYSGFQRYDNPTYKFAVDMEEKQRNAFWNPNEISMTSDAQKFFELPKDIQDVMERVWLFQTLMDSGQNKGLEEVLASLKTFNTDAAVIGRVREGSKVVVQTKFGKKLLQIAEEKENQFRDAMNDQKEVKYRLEKSLNEQKELSL